MALPAHSYEEIRKVVIDILLKKENVSYPPDQFTSLVSGVTEVFVRRDKAANPGAYVGVTMQSGNPQDAELVRDVFWDLSGRR